MIVNTHDVRKAKEYLCLLAEEHKQGRTLEVSPQEFFWDNPHLLMPLRFDEYYGIDHDMAEDFENEQMQPADSDSPPKDIADAYGQYVQQTFGLADLWFQGQESLYRDSGSGVWLWFEGITDEGSLHFVGPKARPHTYFQVDEWIERLEKSRLTSRESGCRLWLPQVFSPRVQMQGNEVMSAAIQPILRELKTQKIHLRDISWRSLEEVVAEVLRAKGMAVTVTPRSRDGGRDILARGELATGEPLVFAVEVKQKPVVGLADVQRALKANEDFPSLMVVTSGRFSSGVVREKSLERHQLRLFLKDGVALSQWIDAYKC